MKGIILAGGQGTRLRPLTRITNKHLLPVYNKSMIEYPLQNLIELGCNDILIITGGDHVGSFAEYLGDGSLYEIQLSYRVQPQAGGVAEALGCAQGFIAQDEDQAIIPVILGDNFFHPNVEKIPEHEAIILSAVNNPQRFGVYDPQTKRIEEKPQAPKTNFAVTGLYFYKPQTIWHTTELHPSDRGELEITDLNNYILQSGAKDIYYSGYWSDMGTFQSLMEVANYVKNKS